MRLIQAFLLILLFSASLAQEAGNSSIEGGNITAVNATMERNSTWHAVVGQTSDDPLSNVTVNATPGGLTDLLVNTGAYVCYLDEDDDDEEEEDYEGIAILNILFSNSSSPITHLKRGDLESLDLFIFRDAENGTATFLLTTNFKTGNYGTITNVPTTYTNSLGSSSPFRMGYLQDKDDNIVFITPVVNDQEGFNGSLFDFQLMLPTNNGTPVTYYLTVDLKCKRRGEPRGEGRGTRTPYWNITPEELPPAVGPVENITFCDIILYCDEWEPCVDGYRKQKCWDMTNCSDIEVFRVEKCVPAVLPPPKEEEEEIIPIYVVEEEFPCLLLLLLLLLLVLIYIYWKRKKRKNGD
jgi:hypothetical protein